MLQRRTIVGVVDNSLILKARVFHVYSKNQYAYVGDIVRASVVSRKPGSPFKKGEVIKGLVVRTKKFVVRDDGTKISCSTNDIIVLSLTNKMVQNRIIYPVFKEYNKKYDLPDVKSRVKSVV